MRKKYLYLQAVLLTGFIGLNIFPAGCLSWGGAPTVVYAPSKVPVPPTNVSSTPTALPSPTSSSASSTPLPSPTPTTK